MARRSGFIVLCWGTLLAVASAARPWQALTGASQGGREEGQAVSIASAIDDPHFSTPQGIPFDFHGALRTTYCLITDSWLHINAKLDGYKDRRPFGDAEPDGQGMKLRTWMKELGIFWKDGSGKSHVLHMAARTTAGTERGDKGFLKSMRLDGKEILDGEAPYDGKELKAGGLTLRFLGVEKDDKKPCVDQENFSLRIGRSLAATLWLRPANKQLQLKQNAEVHFNLNVESINTTDEVHGLLGQNFRTGPDQFVKAIQWATKSASEGKPIQADTVQGFLDGNKEDYISSSVTKPDCKVSAFKF